MGEVESIYSLCLYMNSAFGGLELSHATLKDTPPGGNQGPSINLNASTVRRAGKESWEKNIQTAPLADSYTQGQEFSTYKCHLILAALPEREYCNSISLGGNLKLAKIK